MSFSFDSLVVHVLHLNFVSLIEHHNFVLSVDMNIDAEEHVAILV